MLSFMPTQFLRHSHRLDNALFLDVNDAYLQYYEVERQQVIGHTAEELDLPLTARRTGPSACPVAGGRDHPKP